MSDDLGNKPTNPNSSEKDSQSDPESLGRSERKPRLKRGPIVKVLTAFIALFGTVASATHGWLSLSFGLAAAICGSEVLNIELRTHNVRKNWCRFWAALLAVCAISGLIFINREVFQPPAAQVTDPSKYSLLSPEVEKDVVKFLRNSNNHKVAIGIHAVNPDESAYEFSKQLERIFREGGYFRVFGPPPTSIPEIPGLSCFLYGGAAADNAGLLEAINIIVGQSATHQQFSLVPGDADPFYTNSVVVIMLRKK
jgi:hypothetical protein